MPEVITVGEAMALFLSPRTGYLRHQPYLELHVGGAEANLAIALARLGIGVSFVGWLGRDEVGEFVLSRLRAEGVEVGEVRHVDAPTGLYIRERLPGGRGRVYYWRHGSAASLMGPGAFDPTCFDGARLFHLTGITPALSPTARACATWALQEARSRDVRTSLDVNYRAKLWDIKEARAWFEEVLPLIDYLFLSEEDARLWEYKGDDLLKQLVATGPQEVVLKRGSAGAMAMINGLFIESPAFVVEEVDPVGAGDAFTAGYLAGLLWGKPPLERLKLGNAMGAMVVSVLGDYEGTPTHGDLMGFLHCQPLVER